jgi:prolyl-tRNA synthetase
VLERCQIPLTVAEGQSGSIDGAAREFVALSPVGSAKIAWCEEAGYAATLDVAHAIPKIPVTPDPEGALTPERFRTPNRKTIADLVEFTGLPATAQIKSLVEVGDGNPYLILVRGDHQMARAKLAALIGAKEVRPATTEEIAKLLGANPGSLGPIRVSSDLPILADLAIQGRRNMICGANEDGYHLRNVTPGVDFAAQFADLRQVEDGDMCPAFPAAITIRTAHSLGRVSFPGSKYASTFNVRIDESGRETLPLMTVSTIALEPVLRVAAELNQDPDGLVLAGPIAPFDVVITAANFADEAQRKAALDLYGECRALGLDTLLDDRDERPGVKFKDADLIGIPVRITVGKKLSEGLVEVVLRLARQKTDVPVDQAAEQAKNLAIG